MFRQWLSHQQPTWLIAVLFVLGVSLDISGANRKAPPEDRKSMRVVSSKRVTSSELLHIRRSDTLFAEK